MTLDQFRADPLAQRKAAIFAGVIAVALAWLWLPWPLSETRQPPQSRQQSRGPVPARAQPVARAAAVKTPSAAPVVAGLAAPAAPVAAPAAVALPVPAATFVPAPLPISDTVAVGGAEVFRPLLGKWDGRSVLTTRGGVLCHLAMELREDEKQDGVVNGNTSLACSPISNIEIAKCKPADRPRCIKEMQEKAAPTSAILTGKVEDKAIRFQVDENIGTEATGCVMTSATVRDFGARQIAVTWKDACGGGKLVLRKVRG